MTVLTVVEKADAVSVFRKIDPLVSADLKLSLVIRSVSVSGTRKVTELYVAERIVCHDINGECRLKKNVVLVPINIVVEIDPL